MTGFARTRAEGLLNDYYDPPLYREILDAYRDEVLREAAELIRQLALRDSIEEETGMLTAANLIDPEVEL